MAEFDRRPYTILSCGISLDGYLDAATQDRLVLSNDADLERVDAVRAGCDAILVGAATIRNDNPRLVVRKPALREQRVARGWCETPMKVTLTGARTWTRAATSSRPVTARSWSTARARLFRARAAGSTLWRPSSTEASRWTCGGCWPTSTTAASDA